MRLILISQQSRRTPTNERSSGRQRSERVAKDSFRVRRSNLLEISGRGGNRKRLKQRKQYRCSDASLERDSSAHILWPVRIILAFKDASSYLIGIISRFIHRAESLPSNNASLIETTYSTPMPPTISMEGYYDNVKVVGLDCEMVGGGKGGMKSLLARCSVVTLDCIPIKVSNEEETCYNNMSQNLVVIYDKYVIPKGRIKDYRTQWSGITKDTYSSNENSIPIVTFHQCQKEVTELFSSIDGKSVVVVGHALENDFDALEIKHPRTLTRDTAFYRPYMRQVRRRLFPRKLSTLSSEELGIEIQQEPQFVEQNETADVPNQNNYSLSIGHSSVEDAAAALKLYWHRCQHWERSLRYPLLPSTSGSSTTGIRWPPLKCMYLDCCNLPLGLRGVDFKEILGVKDEAQHEGGQVVSAKSARLVSRHSTRGDKSSAAIDFLPYFKSSLLPGTQPQIESIVIVFDGAKFRDITKKQHRARLTDGYNTKRFHLESPKDHGVVGIEITEDGSSADDVLFHKCFNAYADRPVGKVVSLNEAADILSNKISDENDLLDSYVVIRRKAGGSKTHRRLFDKLHLRRANEGALCLSGLTANLHNDSWKTVRELRRERGVEKVVECELRGRDELTHVVVTDDVFLTERLVQLGTVLVLSYRQMENMF
ncbi:hypothetical protein HJC23_002986 [Cyclotella cryptica]|uniref:Exonuclease domain-containing protein n=1 Tax=Cyclotella cryptica TaxID=29204 RepID=A0ABD3PT15_9STRA